MDGTNSLYPVFSSTRVELDYLAGTDLLCDSSIQLEESNCHIFPLNFIATNLLTVAFYYKSETPYFLKLYRFYSQSNDVSS